MEIRRTVTILDEILIAGAAGPPELRVAAIAVVRNPLATTNDENLNELVNEGADVGRYLADRVVQYVNRSTIVAIGKAAIVGLGGEPEHAQSILYPKFAQAVRAAFDLPQARMIGDKKLAQAGTPIKVSLAPINGVASGPMAGEMELRVPGSPQEDEILVALVVAGSSARG